MVFVIPPGRNKILAVAWAGHVADQRKASKHAPKPEVETPAKGRSKAPAKAAPALAHPKPEKAKPGKRTPNKAEKQWLDAVVAYGCIACRIDGQQPRPAAVHHLLRGGQRIGHLSSIGLCDPGHHQGGQPLGMVSRHPNKAAFEAKYGTEAELLERTRKALKQQARR